MCFAHSLTLLFLKRLAILPFLRFHLGAHLADDIKQLLVLCLQRRDTVEEYEVISDNLVNVFSWRCAFIGLQFLIRRNGPVLSPGDLFQQCLNLPS